MVKAQIPLNEACPFCGGNRGGGGIKTTIYHLFVLGVPKAQPRPRMTASGHVYNPDSADAWKETVRSAFVFFHKPPITNPVRLRVNFFLPRPKAMKEGAAVPHTKKPDVDNLLKAVMDSMTAAGVWKDDALVYATEADKWYATGKPGAQIIVESD
jgi:Holliday junction resolvase RusA-like endonuclease